MRAALRPFAAVAAALAVLLSGLVICPCEARVDTEHSCCAADRAWRTAESSCCTATRDEAPATVDPALALATNDLALEPRPEALALAPARLPESAFASGSVSPPTVLRI
jgi:hypothetical protein